MPRKKLRTDNFIAWDTENNGLDLAWCSFYDGKTFKTFNKRSECLIYLDTFKEKQLFIATNSEYDLINLFTTETLITQVKMIFGKAVLIRAEYKNCVFLDSLNHWKIGVAEQGKKVGLKKGTIDYKSPELFSDKGKKYCELDTLITYKYAKEMLNTYDRLGVPFNATIASSALSFFMKKYNPVPVRKVKKPDLSRFKKYYMGGRTECFRVGIIKGDILGIDINSMYPYEMMSNSYPNPYNFKHKRGEYVPNNAPFSLCKCIVESNLSVPVLPRRHNGKLTFPNGRFVAYCNSHELDYFISLGGKIVKTLELTEFTTKCHPFKKYINTLYSERLKATGYMKEVIKCVMNSTYGKFSQDRIVTRILSFSELLRDKKAGVEFSENPCEILNPFHDEQKEEYFLVNSKAKNYPYQTNYSWGIFTCAFARVSLHKLLTRVKEDGNDILYCDTDSVIYRGKPYKGSSKIGDFKQVFQTSEIVIQNLKQYKYNTTIKCKGIPKDKKKEYFDKHKTGERVFFEKPVRLKQSLRAVDKRYINANVWSTFHKENKSDYEKGIVKPDGKIIPLDIYDFC